MSDRYAHVLSFVLAHAWAVERDTLRMIAAILAPRIAGAEPNEAAIEAALVNRKNLPQPRAGNVAIIPMYGVLSPRMNLMSEMSGGTTYQALSASLRASLDEPTVKTIVFDVDSPGGSVAGATEFAAQVRAARKVKPIIAVAQYTMASAAYWTMAGATEIVASPSARVGSIGVYTAHDDLTEAFAKAGIKRTYIASGDGKIDGNEAEALSEEALARIKATVDDAYGMFTADVSKGRGGDVTPDHVAKKWQAHVYGSADAKSLGLVDRIGTLDETVARVMAGEAETRGRAAARDLQGALLALDL